MILLYFMDCKKYTFFKYKYMHLCIVLITTCAGCSIGYPPRVCNTGFMHLHHLHLRQYCLQVPKMEKGFVFCDGCSGIFQKCFHYNAF